MRRGSKFENEQKAIECIEVLRALLGCVSDPYGCSFCSSGLPCVLHRLKAKGKAALHEWDNR